jgi:TetR/AcrR family transcriptional regulator
MTETARKVSRKQAILQALAMMLERDAGERITTARLAKEVGVSEAALYRHFPSKARMFEALIGFIEETLFSRINRVLQDDRDTLSRCQKILTLVLTFSARNPGISRLMAGEALTGEQPRLRQQIHQLFERLNVQLKQVLRESALMEGDPEPQAVEKANLMLAFLEGRIRQYVRSDFAISPLQHWDVQWPMLASLLKD